jgi:hypothetical protein
MFQLLQHSNRLTRLNPPSEAFRPILLNRRAGNRSRASDRVTDHAGLVGEETTLSGRGRSWLAGHGVGRGRCCASNIRKPIAALGGCVGSGQSQGIVN